MDAQLSGVNQGLAVLEQILNALCAQPCETRVQLLH